MPRRPWPSMRPSVIGYSRRMRLPSTTPQPAAFSAGSMCSARVSASFIVPAISTSFATSAIKLRNQTAQLRDGGFFYVQTTFVFGQIPFPVGRIQHAPAGRGPMQRVREALKHGVAVFAAITMPSQGGQGGRVRGVVSAREAAFRRDAGQSGVRETGARHCQHAADLGFVARLGLELADAHQIIERGQAQRASPIKRNGWAAPERD